MSFELPENFTPDFEKAFMISGNRFTIQVQAHGIIERRWTWVYSIVVKGHSVSPGLFYWDQTWGELTNESVANRLASFWGPSEVVKKAQKLPETSEVQLDRIVENCAYFMFRYYSIDGGRFDYDILRKDMDEESWTVALMPNVGSLSDPKDPYERMILFYKHKDAECIQISTFENKHNFQRRTI